MDDLREQLSAWIDKGVIADSILELWGVNDILSAQSIWLNFLETELHQGLERVADALFTNISLN